LTKKSNERVICLERNFDHFDLLIMESLNYLKSQPDIIHKFIEVFEKYKLNKLATDFLGCQNSSEKPLENSKKYDLSPKVIQKPRLPFRIG